MRLVSRQSGPSLAAKHKTEGQDIPCKADKPPPFSPHNPLASPAVRSLNLPTSHLPLPTSTFHPALTPLPPLQTPPLQTPPPLTPLQSSNTTPPPPTPRCSKRSDRKRLA